MTFISVEQKKNSCQVSGLLERQNNQLLTNSSGSGDNFRAERTPGAVAVSGLNGRELAGATDIQAKAPAGNPQTNSLPLPSQTPTTRIISFSKLKALLQPVHGWFSDKKAVIAGFRIYQDKEVDLVYPEVSAAEPGNKAYKDNPYRRYRLNRRSSTKSYKRIRKFVEGQHLEGQFKVASLVITMPKYVSENLASRGKAGRDAAWRLFEGFWGKDLPLVVKPEGIELASHTNLHLWKTEMPLQPHFHFHTLIPNFGLKPSLYEDDSGEAAMELTEWEWHRQRGGRCVPFSEEGLEQLKGLWCQRLNSFCKRHGLKRVAEVNIYVEYVDEWRKLLFKLNYNGRHWAEDYCKYSAENLECDNPPEWLLNYENRARVKGWWSNLKNIVVDDKEVEKISPYTGETMKYLYQTQRYEALMDHANGQLGYVEFSKGVPTEGMLSEDELTWLKGVMKKQWYDDDELDDIIPDTT